MAEVKTDCDKTLSWLIDIMKDPIKSKHVKLRPDDSDTQYKWDLYQDFDISKETQDGIDKEIKRRGKHQLKFETIISSYEAGDFHPIKYRINSYAITDISIYGYIHVEDVLRSGKCYIWLDITDRSNHIKFYDGTYDIDMFKYGKSKLSINYRYGVDSYMVDMDEYVRP